VGCQSATCRRVPQLPLIAMNSRLDHPRPALPLMVLRGLTHRCAWCGGRGAFFNGWFKKTPRCHTCGLSWERNLEGFELGAATMGVFITFGSILLWMGIAVLTGVSLVPLLIVAGCIAVTFPVMAYPLTYAVWFGVDLFIRAPSEEDFAAARQYIAEQNK